MDISEAEHEIPHDFGSICDAGDTKNFFVVVWTRGSVVRCDSSHVMKKNARRTGCNMILSPGVADIPRNRACATDFTKVKNKI